MKSAAIHSVAIPLGSSERAGERKDQPVDVRVLLPGLNKLPEASLAQDVLLLPDRMPVTPTRRLVVLVPPGETEEQALVNRVWQIASTSHLAVLFLAIEPDDFYIPYQRRRLSGMASQTTGLEVRARASVYSGQSWMKALEAVLHPGDLLVCVAGYKAPGHLFTSKALDEILVETASLPVYVVGGLRIGLSLRQRQRINELKAWTASTLLIIAFFGLQVEIDRSMGGSIATLVLILSVALEFYSLWLINRSR